MKNINKGIIYCIIGALSIGFGNVAGKLATKDIDPLVLSTLTTIVVLIVDIIEENKVSDKLDNVRN